jgi:hypothetical protein
LSDQSFDIIFITKAMQLDENQQPIADVYDLVSNKDETFAPIPQNQYIRVTFEGILHNSNDITLWAKSDARAKIGVYPVNSDGTEGDVLTTVSDGANPSFDNITSYRKYRVLLSNLQTPTDVFDLKVVPLDPNTPTNIQFDYIVDPSSGPNNPGTVANDAGVGTVAWDNVTNVISSDNSYASIASTDTTPVTTQYIKATNFGFFRAFGSYN